MVFSNGDYACAKLSCGLITAAALFTGIPVKAELGCTCIKLGAPAMCTSGVTECTMKGGGVCVLPCDYSPPKMMKHHRHHKKK